MTKITIAVNSQIHEKLRIFAENSGVELEILAAEFVEDMVYGGGDFLGVRSAICRA